LILPESTRSFGQMRRAEDLGRKDFFMKMELPLDQGSRTLAYRLMSYEVRVLEDQIVLTLQYATTVDAASVQKRILQLAMPPEGAIRAAMGLLEAARAHLFDEPQPQASAKH
jgi:hypothetical protein